LFIVEINDLTESLTRTVCPYLTMISSTQTNCPCHYRLQ